MFLPRRTIAALGWVSVLAVSLHAFEFKLPPLSGNLSGKIKVTALAGAPEMQWTAVLDPTQKERRHVEAGLDASGAHFKVKADLATSTGDGTWEVTGTELDAAVWLALLSPQMGKAAADLVAGGKIEVQGAGTFKAGKPIGVLKVTWREGSLRNSAEGWTLEGITLACDVAADFSAGAAFKQHSPATLGIRTITTTRFGARNLSVAVQLKDEHTLSLIGARAEIAGGEITIDAGLIRLSPTVLDFTCHVNRVGLQDLVALFPAKLADAQGRIDGSARVGWSKAAGLQFGEGQFRLLNDEAATLRLAPTPGLLTAKLGERVTVLPAWTGPLRNRITVKNPAYPEMRAIELGQAPLEIEAFELRLTPEGDDRSRSAVLHVSARPAQAARTIKRVSFDINVTGSLSELFKAADSRASLEVQTKL